MNLITRLTVVLLLVVATLLSARAIKKVYGGAVFTLETTFSPKAASEFVDASPDVPALRRSIYLDYFFIPCYTALLCFLCLWAGDRRFAAAALVAGTLDAFVENPIMLLEIDGASSTGLTFFKALGSWAKWLLLLAVVVYLVIAAVVALKQAFALELARQ